MRALHSGGRAPYVQRVPQRRRAHELARPLNVLALVTDAYGGYGGIAQYNRDLIAALASRTDVSRIDVIPRLTPSPTGSLPQKVHAHRARRSRLGYAVASALSTFAHKPRMIFNGHLYHGPLAEKLSTATGAKLISQLHGVEVWGDVSAARIAPLLRSHLILCVSNDTKDRLAAIAPGLETRAIVLPNMVSAKFVPGDRDASRRRFGLANEKVILTVGRLDKEDRYKGHDTIIRLLPRLQRQDQPPRYLIAGDGTDRARLELLARECGVAQQVRFLGRVSDEALVDLYRAADVFAMPSRGEGFGIVFLEAMACGIPALGLNEGGATEALACGDPQWCVKPDAFADALAAALQHPISNRQDLSARVHARFGLPAFSRQVDVIFDRLLSDG